MAKYYDGVNDKISVSDNNVFSPSVNDISVFSWMRVNTTDLNVHIVVGKSDTSNSEWGIYKYSNTFRFLNWQSGGSNHHTPLASTTTWGSTDGWVCGGGKYDYLITATLYFKGVNEASVSSFSGVMTNGTAPVTIGELQSGVYDTEGDISFTSIWNTLLDNNDMSALSHGVNPFIIKNQNLQLLIIAWGHETTCLDYSRNQRNGTITGAVASTTNPLNPPVELLENYL